MAPDELGGRGDREPLLGRRTTIAVAVLAASAVGLAVAGEVSSGGPGSADATPTPTATAQPRAVQEPPAVVSTGWVANDVVCPVQTDGRRLLIVRFILANRSGRELVVTSVEPVLPLGGLSPRSTSTIAGDCHRWVPTDTGSDSLPVDGQRVVSMLFRLPQECPHPLPVRARVTVRAQSGSSRTVELPVLADLGGVPLDACPDDAGQTPATARSTFGRAQTR